MVRFSWRTYEAEAGFTTGNPQGGCGPELPDKIDVSWTGPDLKLSGTLVRSTGRKIRLVELDPTNVDVIRPKVKPGLLWVGNLCASHSVLARVKLPDCSSLEAEMPASLWLGR